MLFGFFQKSKAQSVGSSGAPLLLRTLVAALSKVEDRHTEVRSAACAATEALVKGTDGTSLKQRSWPSWPPGVLEFG